ncbi:mycothiol transferase [Streptomyces sp. QHH-9511]|uniref:mycothiol transferase n=1 Tax=Streptomyces sp. QHH-9511 TaxID=2684468 RepID=UPI0022B79387|nr:DUF664 domain-containing protein [Streptomyces sp. QHH-9511]
MAEVLAAYAEAAERTDAVIAGTPDLGQAVPVPRGLPWFPQEVGEWSVRWVLLHLIEETARRPRRRHPREFDGATRCSPQPKRGPTRGSSRGHPPLRESADSQRRWIDQ